MNIKLKKINLVNIATKNFKKYLIKINFLLVTIIKV